MIVLAFSILPLLLAGDPSSIELSASEKSPQDQHAREASETAERQALAQSARADRGLAEQKSRGLQSTLEPSGCCGGRHRQKSAPSCVIASPSNARESGDNGVSFVQHYSGDFGGFAAQTIDGDAVQVVEAVGAPRRASATATPLGAFHHT